MEGIPEADLIIVSNPFCSQAQCANRTCWRAYCKACWSPIEAHAPTRELLLLYVSRVLHHNCHLSIQDATEIMSRRIMRRRSRGLTYPSW